MHTKIKPRTFYVAGKAGRDEPVVKAIHSKLIGLGLELTYDWTIHTIPKPFSSNPEQVSTRAKEMVAAIAQSDIFVAIVNEGGIGVHIETGLALLPVYYNLNTHVFVVGRRSSHSIFYFLPNIKRLTSVKALVDSVRSLL